MKQTQKDIAIVLKHRIHSERDQWVTAITQDHGVVVALAKNSIHSRRFGSAIDLFVASDWAFTLSADRTLALLTEAYLREPFSNLKTDWNSFLLACALNEWLVRMLPRQIPCPALFQLHANALYTLHHFCPIQKKIAFLNVYLGKLLQWNGTQPRIFQCLQCLTPIQNYPPSTLLQGIPSSTGWRCPQCATVEAFPIVAATLLEFIQSLKEPIREFSQTSDTSEEEHKKLFQFLEAIFIFHISGFDRYPLNSLAFLGLKSNEKLLQNFS